MSQDTIIDTKERDFSLDNAISISRQWGILVDDYRYLLQKFSSDCSCHLKFDNMFFLKGMEQRHEALKRMANDNEYLSSFSNDDNDWTTLNDIWQKRAVNKNNESTVRRLIRRINVVDNETDNSKSSSSDTYPRNQASSSGLVNSSTDQQSGTKRTRRHPDRISSQDDNENNETDGLNLPSKVYKCQVKECDFTTMNQGKCQAHIRYHQGHTLITPAEDDGVLHICHDCGKEFSTEEGLKNHIQNAHIDVKIWQCEVVGCKYSTKFRSCFRDHMIRHTGRKNFACDWEGCEKNFRTRRDLMAHINFHHRCIRRFMCDFPDCGLSFKDSNRLKHHSYIHTGERPYKCKYRDCEASFKQIPHLKKHEKIHLNKHVEEEREEEEGEEYAEYYVLEEGVNGIITCPTEDCNSVFVSSTEFNNF